MSLINYLDDFLDKVVISILRDWNDQHWKFDFNKERIEEIKGRLTSVTARADKQRVSGSSDTDDMIAGVIDKKTILERGYQLATEYINELQPCWERLTEEEQIMLVCRFVDRNETRGIDAIMARYYIGKTEAYDRSNAALRHLRRLIFW
jgi:hypothetical protein